jgi:hypothetical protein
MNDSGIAEFFYIAPAKNVTSMLRYGILSHRRIDELELPHVDVSDDDVQERRNHTLVGGVTVTASFKY